MCCVCLASAVCLCAVFCASLEKDNIDITTKFFVTARVPTHIALPLQAKKLDQMLADSGEKIDAVINFEIPDSVLVERVTGRLIHAASGRSYHTKFNPPKVAMTDDVTGEPLMRRSDDNEATLVGRLQSFHKSTTPVIDYYNKVGALRTVDANKSLDSVEAQVRAAVAN